MTSKRYKLKVSLLGDGAVGKTSLIRRYVYDEYDDNYILTLGAKTTMKNLEMSSMESDTKVEVTMMIWDIMGQKEFKNLHKTFFKGSHGAFIVADVTRRETLTGLDQWVHDLFEVTGEIPLVFIVNKWDLQDKAQFTFEEFEAAAKRHNAPCYKSSAKTGINVDAFFYKQAQIIVEKNIGEKITEFKEEVPEPEPEPTPSPAPTDEEEKPAKAPRPPASGSLSAEFEKLVDPLLDLIGRVEDAIQDAEEERKKIEGERKLLDAGKKKLEEDRKLFESKSKQPPSEKKEAPAPPSQEPPPPDDVLVELEPEEDDGEVDNAAITWEDSE